MWVQWLKIQRCFLTGVPFLVCTFNGQTLEADLPKMQDIKSRLNSRASPLLLLNMFLHISNTATCPYPLNFCVFLLCCFLHYLLQFVISMPAETCPIHYLCNSSNYHVLSGRTEGEELKCTMETTSLCQMSKS